MVRQFSQVKDTMVDASSSRFAALFVQSIHAKQKGEQEEKHWDCEDPQQLLYFIAYYKYLPRYQVMWWFVAGLMGAQIGEEEADPTRDIFHRYWRHFWGMPRDVVGVMDAALHIRCVEESGLWKPGFASTLVSPSIKALRERVLQRIVRIGRWLLTGEISPSEKNAMEPMGYKLREAARQTLESMLLLSPGVCGQKALVQCFQSSLEKIKKGQLKVDRSTWLFLGQWCHRFRAEEVLAFF